MSTGRRRSDSLSSPWGPLQSQPEPTDNINVQPSTQDSSSSSPSTNRASPPLRVDIPPQSYDATYHPSARPSADTPALSQDQEFDFSDGVIGEEIFDDVNLTALEKIYLFARSQAIFHRVFISRSLPSFLHEVPPHEAVEYVLPLLNSLGTDPDESVKEAFVSQLVPTMWWFYTHTQLVEDESLIPQPTPQESNDASNPSTETHTPVQSDEGEWPMIPVQTFTPLLGHLLLSSNQIVAEAARTAIVEFLKRLRNGPDLVSTEPVISSTAPPSTPTVTPSRDWSFGSMGQNERSMLERELLFGVVIGMARLDQPDDVEGGPSAATGPAEEDNDMTDEQLVDELVDRGEDLIENDDDWLGPSADQPFIEKDPSMTAPTLSSEEDRSTAGLAATMTLDPMRDPDAAQSPSMTETRLSSPPSPTSTSTTLMPSVTVKAVSPSSSDIQIDSPMPGSPAPSQPSVPTSSSTIPIPSSPEMHVVPLPVSDSVVTTPITASPPTASTSTPSTSSTNTLLMTALKKRLTMHQEEELVRKEIQDPMPSSPVLHLETLPQPVASVNGTGAIKMMEGAVTPSVLENTPPLIVASIEQGSKEVEVDKSVNESIPTVQVELSPSFPLLPMDSRPSSSDSTPSNLRSSLPRTSRPSSNANTPIQTPLASQPASPLQPPSPPVYSSSSSYSGGLKGGSSGSSGSNDGSDSSQHTVKPDHSPEQGRHRPMDEVVEEVRSSFNNSSNEDQEEDFERDEGDDLTPKPGAERSDSPRDLNTLSSSGAPSPVESGRGSASSAASRPPPLTSDSDSTIASASSSGTNTTVDTPEGSDGSIVMGGADIYSPPEPGGSGPLNGVAQREFSQPYAGMLKSIKGKERMVDQHQLLQDELTQEESVVDLTSPPFLATSVGGGQIEVANIVEGTSYMQPFVNALPTITAPPFPDVFSSSTSTGFNQAFVSPGYSFPSLPPPPPGPSSSTTKARPSTPPPVAILPRSRSSAGSSDENENESPSSSPRRATTPRKGRRRSKPRRSSSSANTPSRYTFSAAAAAKRRNSTDGGMGFLPMGGLKSRLSDTEIIAAGLSRRRSWSSEGTRAIGESAEEMEGDVDRSRLSPPRPAKSPISFLMRSPMMKAVTPPVSPPPLVDRSSATAAGSAAFSRAKSPIPLLTRFGRGETSDILVEEEDEDNVGGPEETGGDDDGRVPFLLSSGRFNEQEHQDRVKHLDNDDDPFMSFVASAHGSADVLPTTVVSGERISRRVESKDDDNDALVAEVPPTIGASTSAPPESSSTSNTPSHPLTIQPPAMVSSPEAVIQELEVVVPLPRTPQRLSVNSMSSFPVVSPHTGLEEDPAWSVYTTISQQDTSYFSDIPRTSTKDLFDFDEIQTPKGSVDDEIYNAEVLPPSPPEAESDTVPNPSVEPSPSEAIVDMAQAEIQRPLSPDIESTALAVVESLPPDSEPTRLVLEFGLPYIDGYIPENVQDDGTRTTEGDLIDGSTAGCSEEGAVGRVASMSLISCIAAAGVISEETTRAFSAEVFRVGKDPVYWVRREAAYALGALAKVAPFDVVFSTLLNLYDMLVKDAVWIVRQSALFALPGILGRLPAHQRRPLALSQTAILSQDLSRSVRSGLLEIMGEVIYTFRDDKGGPPTELVDLFVGRGEVHEEVVAEKSPTSQWHEAAEGPTWDLPETPFASRKLGTQTSKPSSPHSIFEDNSDSGSSSDTARELFGSRSSFVAGANEYSQDPERTLICAFNFPAVVLATGKDRWTELSVYYHILTQSQVAKVRRTLGASLGEIARIIGPENARQDLLPVWWDAIHDNDTEVRIKVIKSLDVFVAALSHEDRVKVGQQFDTLWTKNLKGWREREVVAGLVGSLASSLAQAGDFESVRMLAVRAMVDPVAAVREAAINSFPKLLLELSGHKEALDQVYVDLYSLASADTFRKRTVFISTCLALILADAGHRLVESDVFWGCLKSLSDDAVIDVRISLSRLVAIMCERLFPDVYARPPAINELSRKLCRDPSRDVKSYVSHTIHSPISPLTAVSSSSSGQMFATFSRPPAANPLLTDDLDDFMGEDDLDMDLDLDLEEADHAAQLLTMDNGSDAVEAQLSQ